MGYLFEKMEHMDIQAERENTRAARKALAEARQKTADAKKNAADMGHVLDILIRNMILSATG